MTFGQGALWQRVVETTAKARRIGALVPVPTDCTFIEDSGIPFLVRVLTSLSLKDEERKRQAEEEASGKEANPFLPFEQDLFVSDISDSHAAVLNKYNVVEHHVLLVTRHFEEQDTLLTLKDFEALRVCLADYDSLGFYNAGRAAGASQRHKHLQIVPLPLAPEGPAVPIEPLLVSAITDRTGLGTVPMFPFLHTFGRLEEDLMISAEEAAEKSFTLYATMLRALGMKPPAREGLVEQSIPYCLLMTRRWMLIVPRSHECFDDISLNSLAFAGSLFVRNEGQLRRLRSYGPMRALASVALPRR